MIVGIIANHGQHTCQAPSALSLQSITGFGSVAAPVADDMGLIQDDSATRRQQMNISNLVNWEGQSSSADLQLCAKP